MSYLLQESGDRLLLEDESGALLLEGVLAPQRSPFAGVILPKTKKKRRKKKQTLEVQFTDWLENEVSVITVELPEREEIVTYNTYAEELALLLDEDLILN